MTARAPSSTLFPYTTLFRSGRSPRIAAPREEAPSDAPGRTGERLAYFTENGAYRPTPVLDRSEEHTSELQSHSELVCRLLLEKKKINQVGSIWNTLNSYYSD